METQRPFPKFSSQKHKIEELEKNSPRFKTIYSEYELMTTDLFELENSEAINMPDDFINVVKLQIEYLEEEISDWLLDSPEKE
jgi:hypothetical protein